jgi:formate hydrogenlyase subunit 3/multisubunit Na+/H+ antiporter MnhD subunit
VVKLASCVFVTVAAFPSFLSRLRRLSSVWLALATFILASVALWGYQARQAQRRVEARTRGERVLNVNLDLLSGTIQFEAGLVLIGLVGLASVLYAMAWRARGAQVRVEAELYKSEQRYRLLFDYNPQPMWV